MLDSRRMFNNLQRLMTTLLVQSGKIECTPLHPRCCRRPRHGRFYKRQQSAGGTGTRVSPREFNKLAVQSNDSNESVPGSKIAAANVDVKKLDYTTTTIKRCKILARRAKVDNCIGRGWTIVGFDCWRCRPKYSRERVTPR